MTWQALYASDLQALYAVWIVPALFLAYLLSRGARPTGVEPRASRFLWAYAVVFTLETMLDPFAGGPVLRWLGIGERPIAMVVIFTFVLLGDFRVFALVFGLAAIRAGRDLRSAFVRAAAWTFVVPIFTLVTYRTLTTLAGEQPAQSLWLVYELGFLAVAIVLRQRIVPAHVSPSPLRQYLQTVTTYAAIYYGLWATADLLILTTGADLAWALRMVPNQLYYALYVPFAYLLASARRYAETSSSTQPVR